MTRFARPDVPAAAGVCPRLHAIAADDILDRRDFVSSASALLAWGGPLLALHVRAHGRAGGALYDLAARLLPAAARAGALLVVNDRLDIALALGLSAVQLGRRSLPLVEARRIAPAAIKLGYSAHAPEDAAEAVAAGAAWVLLGTIYETPSHPGRPGAGPALVSATVQATRAVSQPPGVAGSPVIAIGGITPERVPALLSAGAHGVAVLRGIWSAADPVQAAEPFRAALENAVASAPSA
ncbi:MAG TPA: thiamine phosphate synthase [Longimicrobiales bacterium]